MAGSFTAVQSEQGGEGGRVCVGVSVFVLECAEVAVSEALLSYPGHYD